MQIHIGLVSLPGPDAAATRTAPRRFFIAATLPCGNDIAGFLSSRRRGLARRQRELHREGFSSPPLSCAATIQQDFLGFIADTLPRSNDTTKFLAFRCRGLAQRPRELRREGFSSPPLSCAATIQQDFLRFVAGTWRNGNEICAAKVFYCRHIPARQRYNKISCVSLPGPGAAATKTAPRRFFIADTLPRGNDITRFLRFYCRHTGSHKPILYASRGNRRSDSL